MEKLGFQCCFDCVFDSGIFVDVVGIDRYIGIKVLMRIVYKDCGVEYQVDVWYFCKNIKFKLVKKVKKKGCEELVFWIKLVINYFWWLFMICEGNVEFFKEKWISILYYVVDKYSWDLFIFYNCCLYDFIFVIVCWKIKWLKVGLFVYEVLKEVVMEKRFFNDLEFFFKFIYIGVFEVYYLFYNKYMFKR